ncbi:MAG: hypothetical protein ACQES1_02580 [Bacteroidota bacterium]
MQKRYVFLLLAISSVSLIFFGCKKVDENIEGTWLLESLEAEPKEKCIWDFKSNNELIITYNSLGDTAETYMYIDTAYYTIQKELTHTAIKIIESEEFYLHPPVNGFFRVDKITDDILVLTRYKMQDESTDAAYLRREFTRLD